MYELPDIVVPQGDPFFQISRRSKRYFLGDFVLPAPNLPLVTRRETLEVGAGIGLHQLMDFYSMWVIRGGRGIHDVNGHPYGIRRGDVYIMPAGGVHGYREYENVEADAFYFKAELFSQTELAALQELAGFWDLFVPAPLRRNSSFHDRRLHLMPEQYREVEGIIAAIRCEMCSPLSIGPIMARYRFYCLLGILARWHNAGKTERRAASAKRQRKVSQKKATRGEDVFHVASLAEVVQYCDENFSQPLTVAQLAARMCLSESHFAKMFTARVGMPPARYLRSLRLERAQALLRETDLSVTEIAHQSGFANVEHLAHSFQQEFSTTPTQYRGKFHSDNASNLRSRSTRNRVT